MWDTAHHRLVRIIEQVGPDWEGKFLFRVWVRHDAPSYWINEQWLTRPMGRTPGVEGFTHYYDPS